MIGILPVGGNLHKSLQIGGRILFVDLQRKQEASGRRWEISDSYWEVTSNWQESPNYPHSGIRSPRLAFPVVEHTKLVPNSAPNESDSRDALENPMNLAMNTAKVESNRKIWSFSVIIRVLLGAHQLGFCFQTVRSVKTKGFWFGFWIWVVESWIPSLVFIPLFHRIYPTLDDIWLWHEQL